MWWKHLLFGAATSVVFSSCGGSSPTAPSASMTSIVANGPHVLRIVPRCAQSEQAEQALIPLVYTRVEVTTSANDWVATADGPVSGDIQIRFRQSGQMVIPGSMPVSGTMTGTAVHLPELFSGPAWTVRATLAGPASLTGTAFVAGIFGRATSGVDGFGSGSLTLTDGMGNTCTGTPTFSWSLFPLP